MLSSPPHPPWVNPISSHPKPAHASPNPISGDAISSCQLGQGRRVPGGSPLSPAEPGGQQGWRWALAREGERGGGKGPPVSHALEKEGEPRPELSFVLS